MSRKVRLFGLSWLLVLAFPSAHAQESQWQSLAGEASAMSRKISPEKMDYNLEVGPVLLNVGASLTGGYNSNTSLSQNSAQGSAYATPAANLSFLWPLTDLNTLKFSVGVGYAYYFDVPETQSPGGLFVSPNSALQGTFYVGDFRFTPYDQFSLQNDPTQAGELSNVSRFNIFQNSAGMKVDWDLADLVITPGFDWFNLWSNQTSNQNLDRRTLTPSLSMTYYITKTLITGLEGVAAITKYTESQAQTVQTGTDTFTTVYGQNNNNIYQVGPFVNWQLSEYITITGRGGWIWGEFTGSNTPENAAGGNPSTWYLNLGWSHRLNEYLNYQLTASRSTQLSALVGSNFVQTWNFGAGLNWNIIDQLSLSTPFSAQLGQVSGSVASQDYQQYSAGITLGYRITEKLGSSLNFLYILKDSNSSTYPGYQQWNAAAGFNYDF
jgi:hypothetical protein